MSGWYTYADARFDAWVTGNWGEDSVREPEPREHCNYCGGFLKSTPEKEDHHIETHPPVGKLRSYRVAVTREHYTCSRCGHVNTFRIMDLA